mmetsp:Transcript_64519/g.131119  ORF Transcript_64519/g.131119 Transcript_64519/m.131119 type:complete len:275 (-) Transcript_64519:80-904(-)
MRRRWRGGEAAPQASLSEPGDTHAMTAELPPLLSTLMSAQQLSPSLSLPLYKWRRRAAAMRTRWLDTCADRVRWASTSARRSSARRRRRASKRMALAEKWERASRVRRATSFACWHSDTTRSRFRNKRVARSAAAVSSFRSRSTAALLRSYSCAALTARTWRRSARADVSFSFMAAARASAARASFAATEAADVPWLTAACRRAIRAANASWRRAAETLQVVESAIGLGMPGAATVAGQLMWAWHALCWRAILRTVELAGPRLLLGVCRESFTR